MLYDSTKALLGVLLKSLESNDSIGCDDQLESGGECLYEIHQMARPLYQGYRTDGLNRKLTLIAVHERANRAIPHVKLMVKAIRRKDQAAAIHSGKAALAEL